MLLSVVIPVYNVEKYLYECIESVINQKYDNFEIILIDDGSTDNSGNICDEYERKDRRIKVIHQANHGVSVARKVGVDNSIGEYIMFIDSDDLIKNNTLELITDIIEKNKVDIIYYGIIIERKNGEEIKYPMNEREGYYKKNDIINTIFPKLIHNERAEYFSPNLYSKVFKRDLIKKFMLVNERVNIGEDGAIVIPTVYHANTLYILHEHLYYYRYNDNSATKLKKIFNWQCPLIIAEHIKHTININEFDFKNQLYRKITHDFFTTAVTQFYSSKSYTDICEDIEKKLMINTYRTAISESYFKGSYRAFLMRIALKYKLFFLLFLYSKFR